VSNAQQRDLSSLVALAEQAAVDAGEMVRDRRAEVDRMSVAATKSTPTDVVTESDTAAEDLIRGRLLGARPDDGLVGEEGGSVQGTSGVHWIVDPIDGTVNYLYGIPQYCVSIAAAAGETMVAGAVYNPTTNELWTAGRGLGAFLNGRPIRPSACGDVGSALIGTGFAYSAQRRERQAEFLPRLLPTVRDIRRAGSAALDLCAVAMGRLDGFYERGLNSWDIAAGALIAQESGARVTGFRGAEPSEHMTIAAAPGLHAGLEQLLLDVGADAEY